MAPANLNLPPTPYLPLQSCSSRANAIPKDYESRSRLKIDQLCSLTKEADRETELPPYHGLPALCIMLHMLYLKCIGPYVCDQVEIYTHQNVTVYSVVLCRAHWQQTRTLNLGRYRKVTRQSCLARVDVATSLGLSTLRLLYSMLKPESRGVMAPQHHV